MELELVKYAMEDDTARPVIIWLIISAAIMFVSGFIISMLFKIANQIKAFIKEVKPTKDYAVQIEIESQIASLIRDMRNLLKADRVSIWQYNNGEKSIGNVSLMKVQCTHESISQIAMSRQLTSDRFQANILGWINKQLFSGQAIAMPSLETKTGLGRQQLSQDADLRAFYIHLQEYGTKSIFMFPMRDSSMRVIAIGVIEYVTEEHLLEDSDIADIQSRFSIISGMLSGMALATIKVC